MKSQSPSRFKLNLIVTLYFETALPTLPHLNWWWLHYAILPEILQSFLTPLFISISHSVHKEALKLRIQILSTSLYFHCMFSLKPSSCLAIFIYTLTSLLATFSTTVTTEKSEWPSKMHIKDYCDMPETWSGSHFTNSIEAKSLTDYKAFKSLSLFSLSL